MHTRPSILRHKFQLRALTNHKNWHQYRTCNHMRTHQRAFCFVLFLVCLFLFVIKEFSRIMRWGQYKSLLRGREELIIDFWSIGGATSQPPLVTSKRTLKRVQSPCGLENSYFGHFYQMWTQQMRKDADDNKGLTGRLLCLLPRQIPITSLHLQHPSFLSKESDGFQSR